MKVRIHGRALLKQLNGAAWAILPDKLEAIAEFLQLRANGGEVSAEEIRAITSARVDRTEMRRGGVAVLPLSGTMLHRATSMQESSGIVSIERFGQMFDAMIRNPDIDTIVLHVDSPGGTVSGTPELAAKIFEARGQKKIIAIADACMASAAYYVAAAADEICAVPSAIVGSIGVFNIHFDLSKMLEMEGVKATIIKFGQFKAEANQFELLSESAEAHLQETVDTFGQMFVRDVAKYRGQKEKGLHERFGEGRAFTADKAKAVGMIDRVITFEALMEELGVSRDRLAGASRMEENTEIAAVEVGALVDASLGAAADAGTVEIAAGPSARVYEVLADGDMPEEVPCPDCPGDCPDDCPCPCHNDDEDVAGASGGATETQSNTTDHAAPTAEEGKIMSDKDKSAPGGADTIDVGADHTATERKRVSAIYRLCADHEVPVADAEAMVNEGISADAAGHRILERKTKRPENKPVRGEQPDISQKEQREYSVSRAILASVDGNWKHAGFEREVMEETSKLLSRNETGYNPKGGILIPTGLGLPAIRGRAWDGSQLRPRAALETGGTNAGEHFVFTEPGSFIELLRARSVLDAMGATFLTGLQGNVSFPKQTGAETFEWVVENPGSDQSDSDATTGQVTLTPREGQATTSFSRRLLAQGVINAELFVRNSLVKTAALGVDKAGLHGAGTNAPLGLYGQSGVNEVDFGDDLVTFAKIVEMETAIAAENADIGTMGYVTTPEVRGTAKTTPTGDFAGASFIWTGGVPNGEMNGYRAMASNQLSKTLNSDHHGILFGVWENLLVGEWGAMELIVDPYSKKKQGLIEVTIHVIVDVTCRYGEAFSKGKDLAIVAAS